MWKENANLTTQELLTDAQHQTTLEIQKKKQILTELETYVNEQEHSFDKSSVMRRNKAYKQLGNYFMRSYCSKTERAFKMWCQRLREIKHKQEILVRTIQHWKKSQFNVVKRVLREFVSKDRQNDAINDIKRAQIDQNAIMQSSANGMDMQEALKD